MRDIIEIEKDMLPYSFDIVLAGEEFEMEIMYNKAAELFTVTLSKDNEVLVYNEPIIYGHELFSDVYKADLFPAISIVPLDQSEIETEVTYDNFCKTVFLTIDDEPEDSEVSDNE